MCGRYTLRSSTQQIVMRFAVAEVIDATFGYDDPAAPRYNIAPTQPIVVITENSPRVLVRMRWGLVPSWAKDPSIGSRMINARAETLPEKPAFRTALMRRRCLIPADGFYEWRKEGKSGKVRQPVRFRLKDDGLFAFAGLWDEWGAPDGSPLHSCTIITVEANAVVAAVHDRMPAILRREDEAEWLDSSNTAVGDLLPLLAPYPSEEMEAYEVSRRVNSAAAEGPECIKPVDRLEEPRLEL
ncbi:MAG TPA: SOS response-associated peptidase [Chthonomonadaceae bacterium]|nr:SOS response-associated peptidase [Chthonomonadaceae bacterium]